MGMTSEIGMRIAWRQTFIAETVCADVILWIGVGGRSRSWHGPAASGLRTFLDCNQSEQDPPYELLRAATRRALADAPLRLPLSRRELHGVGDVRRAGQRPLRRVRALAGSEGTDGGAADPRRGGDASGAGNARRPD